VEAVRPPERRKAYLGFTVENRDGLAAVASVLADGPAYSAGLLASDLVIAINGVRLRPGELDQHLRDLKPGDPVRLAILRHDTLQELHFEADGRPDGRWSLRRIRNPTESQQRTYESWLGQAWPGDPRREGPVDAPGTTSPEESP
jgi:predicted metalloprotease with PDZ domain